MSGRQRFLGKKEKRKSNVLPPASSRLRTTSVLPSQHLPSIWITAANHFAAAGAKLLFISTKQQRDKPGCCREKRSGRQELLAGCVVSKQMVDTWEKLEDFVRYVRAHRQSSESTVLCSMGLWLFFFSSSFLTSSQKGGGGAGNTYTHFQRSGKALELSWGQYIKCLYTPSFIENKNLCRSACVIHLQVSPA